MFDHDERDDYDDEPWRPRPTPEKMLRNPASILGAFGVIQLGLSILGCISIVVIMMWSLFDPNDVADADENDETIAMAFVCVGCVLTVATNFIIVRGTERMRRCRNYRLAVAAAILSLLSLPLYYCIPVATPVAIWALIVLAKQDVRARFEAVARDKMTKSQSETHDA